MDKKQRAIKVQEELGNMKKYARECYACGKRFNEGYCVGDGESYFCSEECLLTEFTQSERDDLDICYWTTWEKVEYQHKRLYSKKSKKRHKKIALNDIELLLKQIKSDIKILRNK